jgi:hypothetical protein
MPGRPALAAQLARAAIAVEILLAQVFWRAERHSGISLSPAVLP